MSAWGKFLAPVTVSAAGWVFSWAGAGGVTQVTLTAGEYATILHLGDHLRTQLQALGVGPPDHTVDLVTISSVGITTIAVAGITGADWAGTDDDFEAAFGFDGSEAMSGGELTGNDQHDFGWYPGVETFGASLGAGLSDDSRWQADDEILRQYSGSGNARIIAPARRWYRRGIRFDLIGQAEVFARDIGPICLGDRWATDVLWWYQDRVYGTVASQGTQLDPGAPNYEDDTAGNYYYKVTVTDKPRLRRNSSHPDWFSVSMVLAVEPK